MKLKLLGRLPASIEKDLGLSLDTLHKEIQIAFNEVEGIVLDLATHSAAVTADTLVRTGRCRYKGYTVNVATAAGTIDIRDGVAAGGGVIIEQIPIGKAVGRYETNRPWIFESGIFVDYNAGPATGSLVILFEPIQ